MTTVDVIVSGAPTAPRLPARPLPVALVLGWQEGRRLALHPLPLLGLAALVVMLLAVAGDGAREAFDSVTAMPTWFYGVPVYFAAHLVASRDRRAHSGEWLATLPTGARTRVAALCVGALVPTAVCAVVVGVSHAVLLSTQEYFIPPTFWHLAQGPVTVLGGALLGTMVARWTSVPGVALLVMTVMVLVDVWLNNRPETVQTLATYVPWTAWPQSGTAWAGFIGGSPAWHVAYLLALCGMAASGTFLRGVGATRTALVAGGLFTVAAVVTGLAQLP